MKAKVLIAAILLAGECESEGDDAVINTAIRIAVKLIKRCNDDPEREILSNREYDVLRVVSSDDKE